LLFFSQATIHHSRHLVKMIYIILDKISSILKDFLKRHGCYKVDNDGIYVYIIQCLRLWHKK